MTGNWRLSLPLLDAAIAFGSTLSIGIVLGVAFVCFVLRPR